MRFHPVTSIFLGAVASLALYLIILPLFGNVWVDAFIVIFSYIFGGFIAIFYAREKKIQYALYEGIFVMLIIVLLMLMASSRVSTVFNYGVLIIALAMIGGMIGLMPDKNYKDFSPFLAMIGGSVIGYSCMIFLNLITGFNLNPDYSLRMILFVIGIVSFVIGGFLSAYLAKEKKLRYGIYTGIIIIILGLLGMQPSLIYKLPVIHGVAIAIYVISAVIGSYLAIIVAKHQNKNTVTL
jgi:hypothetical protein